MIRFGFLIGLATERRILERALKSRFEHDGDLAVALSAAQPERAARGVRSLIEAGAQALVSFGFAGGLDSALAPGDLVIADTVVLPDGREIEAHRDWTHQLQGLLGTSVRPARIAGSDHPVRTINEKVELRARTGAAAVDMESHILAAAAQDSGLAFIVVRAVSDGANMTVPAGVTGLIGDDGRIAGFGLVSYLLGNLGDIPDLIRLGRYTGAARDSLGRAARTLIDLRGV